MKSGRDNLRSAVRGPHPVRGAWVEIDLVELALTFLEGRTP